MNSIFAIITCFYPDFKKLGRLIESIEGEVDEILLFDNGGLDFSKLNIKSRKIKIESRGENVGLATALNIGCKIAIENKSRFIIAFDQDSNPGKNMILTLKNDILELQAKNERVVAIGPQLIDERKNERIVSPFIQFTRFGFTKWSGNGAQPVSQLITSGCMIDLRIWSEDNKFKDDLFIDFVDNNWCWRMTRKGFVLVGTANTEMPHEISEKIEKRINLSTNTYKPVRRYFQIRNSVYHLFFEPLSLAQKIYVLKAIAVTLVSALISDEHRMRSIWQCARGVMHGIARKLGPFHE